MSRGRPLSAAAAAMIVLLALVLLLVAWKILVTAAIGMVAWRRLYGSRRRRRPKASWAKNVEALALLIAAWNTRGISWTLARKMGRSAEPGFVSNVPARRRPPRQDIPY